MSRLGPSPAASFAVAAALLALSTVVVLERLHTYAEPLERDVAGYAVIGHELLRGRTLYADLWERKPPLLYLTFTAAERVVGYGPAEVFTVNVTAALATLAGCYAAGRAGGGGTAGGLAAATLWAILGGDLRLEANQPNAEVFVNACLTAAFAALVGWPNNGPRLGRAAGVGALFAGATLYKHHVVVTCLAMLAGHLWVRRRRALGEATIAVAVIAAVWAATVGYFAAVGRLGAMVDVLVRQNAAYAGRPAGALLDFMTPSNLARGFGGWIAGPAILVGAWATFGRGRLGSRWKAHSATQVPHRAECPAEAGPPIRLRSGWHEVGEEEPKWTAPVRASVLATFVCFVSPFVPSWSSSRPRAGRTCVNAVRWKLWLGWASGAVLATALPGHLYLHYYQYELPLACVAGGWAAAGLLARPVARWVAVGLGLGLSIAHELPSYCLTPDEWSAAKGVGDFAEQQRLGQRLGRLLRPGERFWEDGQDNTLYFAAGTSPVSGLLYPDPLRTGPDARANQARLWAELTAARPDAIVTRTARLSGADMPLPHLADWLRQQYVPVDSVTADCPGFRVHARRDSRLLHALGRQPATAP